MNKQEAKQRVQGVTLEAGSLHRTENFGARVSLVENDVARDGTVMVNISEQWIMASDALELSAYFKRLHKLLKAQAPV